MLATTQKAGYSPLPGRSRTLRQSRNESYLRTNDHRRAGRRQLEQSGHILVEQTNAAVGGCIADQTGLVRALIRRIDYHGANNKVSLAFHSAEHSPLLAEIARVTTKEIL